MEWRIGRVSFRAYTHQVALWFNHRPIINWLPPWSDRLYSHRKGLFLLNRPLITYGTSSADLAAKRAAQSR